MLNETLYPNFYGRRLITLKRKNMKTVMTKVLNDNKSMQILFGALIRKET